jgi:hypothetical protein
MPTSSVVRFASPCGCIISTTSPSSALSHIDRRLSIPTEHHRCRRERPSSSTTVVISSYPGSLMSKARVNHLIHDYQDVFISLDCVVCKTTVSNGSTEGHMDRCRLSCHELQSAPPLRLYLMPTSSVVRFISPCGCTIITTTLINTPRRIDLGRGRLSQRGRSLRDGPSTLGGTASTAARQIHIDLLRVNQRRQDTEVCVLG